jgi:SpoIID/LytB domain protein
MRALIITSTCVALLAVMVGAVGCSRYRAGSGQAAEAESSTTVAMNGMPTNGTPTAAMPQPPQRPALDREPLIGVLLNQGPRVAFTLLQPAMVITGDQRDTISAGPVLATAVPGGIQLDRLAGRVLSTPVTMQFIGNISGVCFKATVVAPNGRSEELTLAGLPELHLDPTGYQVQLVERIGLENYLVGVVAKEMAPSWPREALKAQAVVARSYAADRYLKNWRQPWQLHWHYIVDMAYPGFLAKAGAAREAVAETRGELLMYGEMPLPTLFHASSGGRTASLADVKPNLTMCDGVTDPAPAMMPVDDAAAKEGARNLNLSRTHWQWSVSLPLATVEAALKKWSAARPTERPALGDLRSVRIAATTTTSGRVAMVAVSHRLNGRDLVASIPGNDFRLAIGPGEIRSTLWTSCEINKGQLTIQGRGFGHGVGLSQISAWQMAKSGVRADDILRHFYSGATLTRKW